MTDARHPVQAIADLVTGALDAPERVELERHLETCEACRDALATQRLIRSRLGALGRADAVPPDLNARVREALDGDAADPRPSSTLPLWRRPVVVAGAVAALLIALVAVGLLQGRSLTRQVARDYVEFSTATLPLELATADGSALEAFFAQRGIEFRTRVLDLDMMQFRLAGGRVHRLLRRPSAAFAYTGPAGEYLLCQMYPGSEEELPVGAQLREHECVKFHVYRRGGLTMVFWREEDVICVLTSDIDPEELVQLAFAKALKPMHGQHHAPDGT